MPATAVTQTHRPASARRAPVAAAAWAALAALWLAVSVQAAAPVRVGGDPRYPPHHFLDAAGQPDGFDVQVLRAIARDEGLLFTRPFDVRHHRLFAAPDRPAVAGIEELAGRRVAVQFGGLAWEWLSDQDHGIALVPVNIESGAVVAVARGKADYALVPDDVGEQAIAREGLEGIRKVGPTLLALEYAFGVSKARPDLVQRLDAGLSRLEASDELLRLRTYWWLQPADENAQGLWPWALAVLGLAAILGGIAAWRLRSDS